MTKTARGTRLVVILEKNINTLVCRGTPIGHHWFIEFEKELKIFLA